MSTITKFVEKAGDPLRLLGALTVGCLSRHDLPDALEDLIDLADKDIREREEKAQFLLWNAIGQPVLEVR